MQLESTVHTHDRFARLTGGPRTAGSSLRNPNHGRYSGRLLFSAIAALGLSLAWSPSVHAQCDLAWTYMQPSDGSSSDNAGSVVSVSGSSALVGVAKNDQRGGDAGAAYVFEQNGSDWVQAQKLFGTDTDAGDQFGHGVGISDDFAIVGAPYASHSGMTTGAAYIFRFNGSSWVQSQKLTAFDAKASDKFGTAVAIDGNVAVVGASLTDDLSFNDGSVYVYRFNGSSWVFEQKLLPTATTTYFGFSVAVSGNVVVSGAFWDGDNGSAAGAAYVFRHTGSNWVREAKLLASDGVANDSFGRVAASGDVIVVGAPQASPQGVFSGAAYVFGFDGTAWQEEGKLVSSDGAAYDRFASSVAVAGDALIVGAPNAKDRTLDWPRSDQGLAYLFRYDDGSTRWNEVSRIVAPNGYYYDLFGTSVAVDESAAGGLAIAVGAPGDSRNGSDSGAAHMLEGLCGEPAGDCTTHADCDDGNPCTTDACSSGVCSNTNNTASCDDGDACTTNDLCGDGACSGTPKNCNDGNVCTTDSCSNGVCQNVNNTLSCNDGDACTTSDRCDSGVCSGTPKNCNDGNVCTTDSCSNGICQNVNNTLSCNDGDACTTNDRCGNGICSGTPKTCDDGTLCTTDSCVNGVCQHTGNSLVCDDGDACTSKDHCSAGVCVGTPMGCDDGVACTVDTCVNGACQHDASLCGCLFDSECDDENPCTTDRCSNNECTYTDNTLGCDDGDACTTNDRCGDGVCSGTPMNCNDGNVCTTDSCSNGVCQNVNNSLSCDDGDACTVSDRCSNGECVGTEMVCDDSVACTQDYCFDGACVSDATGCGCADAADCDDGDPCTLDECGDDGACTSVLLDACCGNGTCEAGESECNCSVDCGSDLSGAECGNGVCETANGEDCRSCPDDCNGRLSGSTQLRFCCGGDGPYAVSCGDLRCGSSGWVCASEPVEAACCGDGVCTGNETACTCVEDCGSTPSREAAGKDCADGLDNDCDGLIDCDDPDCGGDPICWACDRDGVCDPGENCKSCPSDCAGTLSLRRLVRSCCGNGVLERAEGTGEICDFNP